MLLGLGARLLSAERVLPGTMAGTGAVPGTMAGAGALPGTMAGAGALLIAAHNK